MSWVEDIIFAMAPLGIITAMTGAIRVGGPRWMKAVIGRAREGNGVVEVELMSSTSSDVCELWNGDGVVRVLGSAHIIELFYLDPTPPEYEDDQDDDRAVLLQSRNIQHSESAGIYDFESAKSTGNLLEPKRPNPNQLNDVSPENGDFGKKAAPNIAINIGGQRVLDFEFRAVALIGTSLQMGVIVFAGLSVIWPSWKGEFTKGGKPVLPYAFPSMAVGTVALIVGMFLCAHIIERSTAEETWAIQQNQMRVAWLQRGGIVNDQQFDSYLIQRKDVTPKIPANFREGVSEWWVRAKLQAELWATLWPRLRAKLRTKLRANAKRFPRLCHSLLRWLDIDNRQRVMTSRKEQKPLQTLLTAVAISLSLLGFIAQFVGLRGLNWWVTIAQLLAIAIMTVLRAVVRRNLVHDVEPQRIEHGYELDMVARQIKGCADWTVVTWGFDRSGNFDVPSGGHGLGNMVMEARCRLGALSRWGSQWQKTVDSTCEAIEAVMNSLCTNKDVILKTTDLSHTFEWRLIAEVTKRVSEGVVEGLGVVGGVAGGIAGRVAIGVNTDYTPFQIVQLSLSREWLSDGRGWGDWKVDKSKIEAVLGLWMLHFKDPGNWQPLPARKIHRVFGMDGPSERKTYEQWVQRQAKVVTIDIDSTETQYLVGKPLRPQPPSANNSKFLAIISETPLEKICGQIILSEFISNIAEKALESIGGKVRGRGGARGLKASFGLRNTVLDELAGKVQQTGLATVEEAFLSIVPPLRNSGNLPSYGLGGTEVFSDTEKEITTYLEGGRFDQAEPLLLWLLDVTESSARSYEADRKWNEACRMYFHLCSTCDRIKGGEDYSDKAEEAMGLFCERMLISLKKNLPINGHALRDLLGLVHDVLGNKKEEEVWKRRLIKWEDGLVKLEEVPSGILPTSDQIEAGKFLDRIIVRMRLLTRSSDIDGDNGDSLKRTPLILASIQGHTTIVGQLLERKANPDIQDCHGRTALHYASMRGYTSVVRALCVSPQASKSIDIQDRESKTPLDLAIENNHGATVALLIFNGAKDSNDHAKKLLELSILHGSPAAVKAMLNKGEEINFKDEEAGRIPLHWSIWRDSREGIRLLLDGKADVQVQDIFGQTALHYAARKGRTETVNLLLGKGAIISSQSHDNSTALHLAAQNGHEDVLRLLLEKDADVNAQGGHYDNALQAAAHAGSEATVRLLLDQGADIHAQGGHYGNPLQAAAHAGSEATVRLLLDKGTDIHAQGGHYGSPLQAAAHAGSEATVRLLLDKGADIQAKHNGGSTALHRAAGCGHEATVRLLLDKGADIQAKDNYGWTALYRAAMCGHEATVRLLLNKGADIQVKHNDGSTALHQAAMSGHEATVRLLLDKGADIQAKHNDGSTALHWAARSGREATVRLLLDKGADIQAKDNYGSTALHRATRSGHNAVIRLLQQ